MEFLFYFIILSVNDYNLYFITNRLYEKINNRASYTVDVDFKEWVLGNFLSYISIYLIYTQQIGKLYNNFDEQNNVYTFLSPIFYFLMQDFFFYVLHRIVHTPYLYKTIHYVHHKNRKPTSWAGRMSHHIDSNLENIAFTLPAVIMPINQYIWMTCLIFTFIWGNFLHDSKKKYKIKLINDNTDHCLHHYYGEKNYNFSYYFNHWDIIFNTHRELKIKA